MSKAVFVYKNHKGIVETRRVSQVRLELISNPGYGYQPGWFLSGYDEARKAHRSFALANIVLDDDSRFGSPVGNIGSGWAIPIHDGDF
jgi:hypothetical protein